MGTHNGILIPTAVVDKNGRMTTVHKKPVPSVSVPSALVSAAPSLVGPEESQEGVTPNKEFHPTKKQVTPHCFTLNLRQDTVDRRLPSRSKHDSGYQFISFDATDIEVYDVLSTTRNHATAMVLLQEGVRTTEEARNYLKSIDAEPLIDDRSQLAQKALERRIDAATLITFGEYYNPELWHAGDHLERYLDGVEAYSYPQFQTNRRGPLLSDILTGKIRFSDIKTIGLRNCKNFIVRNGNLDTLHELANGSANYTAEQLRDAFNTADGNYDTYFVANLMCRKHGGEWAAGINWSVGAKACHEWLRTERETADYSATEKEFITYANELRKTTFRQMKDIKALFKANVSLGFAVEKSADPERFTVDQLIVMHRGVPAPMVSGWL